MNSKNFFGELKRRNVYRVAAVYAVTAWLLIQAALILIPLEAPTWVLKALLVFLVLGFAIVVFISWAFEATPEGMKRTENVSPDEVLPSWSARKFAVLIITLAVLAASLLVFDLLRSKPAAPGSGAASPNSSLRGDWTAPAPGGAKVLFSFKEDNTLLWVVEEPTSAKSTLAKYRVDSAVTPHAVEIFDIDEGEMKGQVLHGIFELQADGRLKLGLSQEEMERGFTERETILFSRATSPIVRPASRSAPSPSPAQPPDEQQILIGHGRYLRDDLDGALQAYNKAIELNPKNAAAYSNRGYTFARKGDVDGAIADWNMAIALHPAYAKELNYLIKNLRAEQASKSETSK